MRKLTIAALPVVAVLAIALMTSGGVHTAHATTSCVEVYSQESWVCLTLEPDTASNPVGTDHTVTATLTEGPSEAEQYPSVGLQIDFEVTAGPNTAVPGTCDPAGCETDADGKVTFTYTDAAGVVETPDTITGCYNFVVLSGEGQPAVREIPEPICDAVEKEWYAPTPTPSPTPAPTPTAAPTATPTAAPTPTPSPTPVVAEVVEEPEALTLPDTGGAPSDGGSSGLPWLAAIAGAIAMTSAGGLWFAYQRRRIR